VLFVGRHSSRVRQEISHLPQVPQENLNWFAVSSVLICSCSLDVIFVTLHRCCYLCFMTLFIVFVCTGVCVTLVSVLAHCCHFEHFRHSITQVCRTAPFLRAHFHRHFDTVSSMLFELHPYLFHHFLCTVSLEFFWRVSFRSLLFRTFVLAGRYVRATSPCHVYSRHLAIFGEIQARLLSYLPFLVIVSFLFPLNTSTTYVRLVH
jgi:hypothetical protein